MKTGNRFQINTWLSSAQGAYRAAAFATTRKLEVLLCLSPGAEGAGGGWSGDGSDVEVSIRRQGNGVCLLKSPPFGPLPLPSANLHKES